MKKIILFLLLVFPLILFAQVDRHSGWTQGATTLDHTGNVDIDGDLTYTFIHAKGSADSISVTIGGTRYKYYKINTGLMTWYEATGVTAAADSITILTTGHYLIDVILAATTSNANDRLRVKLYVNNAPLGVAATGRWTINSEGTGLGDAHSYLYYREFQANDVLSLHIVNNTGDRAIDIQDVKIYIEKKPE